MARFVQLRSRAASDVDDIVDQLVHDAGSSRAFAFITALESALRHIATAPNSGSLKFGYELGIPELRAWRLRRQPYIVFYVPLDDRAEVWRVLHERRDIPGSVHAGD